ncbi:phosphotransferase family protein [soil metagenome]
MKLGENAPGAVEAALARLAPELLAGATGVTGVQRLTAGASLQTWRFDVVAPGAERRLILRRRTSGPEDEALETALPLSSEAALLRAAAQAGAPVPAVARVCSHEDGLGEGLITEGVEGETLGRRIAAAPEFEAVRGELGAQAGAALAAIHAVKAPERLPIPSLSAAETLARYAELYRETIPLRPVLEAAIRWLGERLPPEPMTPRLVHGDFRNGNLIVDPALGLVAVLDWELAHLGDPAEDIGWICVNSWRFGVTEREVGGFASLGDFLEGYADAGGTPPPLETIRFWTALGSFRWGVMTQMLGARGGADPGTALERAVIARRLSECEVDLLSLMDGGA